MCVWGGGGGGGGGGGIDKGEGVACVTSSDVLFVFLYTIRCRNAEYYM